MARSQQKKIPIGRDTVYGNPFIGPKYERGRTLPYYEDWLRLVLTNKIDGAYRVMDRAKKDGLAVFRGLDYPTKEDIYNLAVAIKGGAKPACPGCRHESCKTGICHGSILLKIIQELTVNEGFLHGELKNG